MVAGRPAKGRFQFQRVGGDVEFFDFAVVGLVLESHQVHNFGSLAKSVPQLAWLGERRSHRRVWERKKVCVLLNLQDMGHKFPRRLDKGPWLCEVASIAEHILGTIARCHGVQKASIGQNRSSRCRARANKAVSVWCHLCWCSGRCVCPWWTGLGQLGARLAQTKGGNHTPKCREILKRCMEEVQGIPPERSS